MCGCHKTHFVDFAFLNKGGFAQALENIHREKMGRGSTASQYDEDIVPPVLRKTIAVYEAGRVLLGYITPGYDEISQVRCSAIPTPIWCLP